MGVLIKGMEMPKSCAKCPIGFFADEYTILHCPLTGEEISENCFVYKRSEHCLLVPVPKHGDLIDRDALPTNRVEWEDIVNAPTIIPADEVV